MPRSVSQPSYGRLPPGGSTGLTGVLTCPASLPHPGGATPGSPLKAAPLFTVVVKHAPNAPFYAHLNALQESAVHHMCPTPHRLFVHRFFAMF